MTKSMNNEESTLQEGKFVESRRTFLKGTAYSVAGATLAAGVFKTVADTPAEAEGKFTPTPETLSFYPPLKEWDIKINYGIKTGFNEAFIIDGKIKDELIAKDKKSADIIKPLLRGRDIKKYSYEFADKWLINTHNGVSSQEILPVEIDDYPAIKNHLDIYYDKLLKRGDKGITPYHLRNCAYLDEFEKEKIVYSEIVQSPQFHIDNNRFYNEASSFFMTGENLKYFKSTSAPKFVNGISVATRP